MKLASHNSWSYLPPMKWWMRPFAFMAKCQSKNIREQYEAGVRLFDLRIRFDKCGRTILAHGLIEYDASGLEDDLRWLNNQLDNITVQVVWEISHDVKDEWDLFGAECFRFRQRYRNLTFVCGCRKFDWKRIYNFHTSEPSIAGCFASAPSDKWYSKLNDLCPWLWAKIHNEKVLDAYKDYDGWVMMDFV